MERKTERGRGRDDDYLKGGRKGRESQAITDSGKGEKKN